MADEDGEVDADSGESSAEETVGFADVEGSIEGSKDIDEEGDVVGSDDGIPDSLGIADDDSVIEGIDEAEGVAEGSDDGIGEADGVVEGSDDGIAEAEDVVEGSTDGMGDAVEVVEGSDDGAPELDGLGTEVEVVDGIGVSDGISTGVGSPVELSSASWCMSLVRMYGVLESYEVMLECDRVFSLAVGSPSNPLKEFLEPYKTVRRTAQISASE